MSAVALSTVIAPNILYPKTTDLSTADPFEPRTTINFVIQHATRVFAPYTADLELALAAMKNRSTVPVVQSSEPSSVSGAQPGSSAPLTAASEQHSAEPGAVIITSSASTSTRPAVNGTGNVFEHRPARTTMATPRPPTEKKPRALPQLKRGEGAHGSNNNNNLSVRAEPESVSHSEHSHEERQTSPQSHHSVSSSRSSFDNSATEPQASVAPLPATRPRPAQNFQNIFAASGGNADANEVKTSPRDKSAESANESSVPSIVVHQETPAQTEENANKHVNVEATHVSEQ